MFGVFEVRYFGVRSKTILYQVSSKSDEKQKSFINSMFFCSEFQSVSRIVKIVHSVLDGLAQILQDMHYL